MKLKNMIQAWRCDDEVDLEAWVKLCALFPVFRGSWPNFVNFEKPGVIFRMTPSLQFVGLEGEGQGNSVIRSA
jgi:hypothetical protein